MGNAYREKSRAVLEWLSQGSFWQKHEEIQKLRIENSGDWFVNSSKFQEWVTSPHGGPLVCTGIRTFPFSSKLTESSWGR
jgi:hypothetical protein